MKIGIFNAETNKNIVRDATLEEISARENEIAEYVANKEAQELEKAQLRATKIAAYEKLGLTEAEIEALLPTPAKPRNNLI